MARREATDPHVALLRGINVGGKNLIRMADLRACFEALGLRDVRTYIQSGNVLFAPRSGDRARLTRRIEQALAETFGYEAKVLLRSRAQLEEVVAAAPADFGGAPGERRCDVLFLEDSLAPEEALAQVPLKEGVDAAAAGPGVLYFSRLAARAPQSRLSRITGLPIYRRLTIRNWNTTRKLAALLSAP